LRRREFLAGLGAATVSPRLVAEAQQSVPVIGFLNNGSSDAYRALDPLCHQNNFFCGGRLLGACH
jgi:hypothetical protein